MLAEHIKKSRQFGQRLNPISIFGEFDILFRLSGHFIDISPGDVVAESPMPNNTMDAIHLEDGLLLLDEISELSLRKLPHDLLKKLPKRPEHNE